MGGLMSLYAITAHNDTFSKAACLSPYLFPVRKDMERECRRPIDPDTRVYLSWGSSETRSKRSLSWISKTNLEMANLLNAAGARVHLNLVLGGTHCEACWEKEIPVFLRFFLA